MSAANASPLMRVARRAQTKIIDEQLQLCAAAVAAQRGITVAALLDAHGRRRRSAGGKFVASISPWNEAVYLLNTYFGVSSAAISRALGIDKSHLRRVLELVEGARDCPRYDRKMDEIELGLMA